MEEITLEKIDIIRERCKVTYTEAKESLEISNGNVVDALVYLEQNKKNKTDEILNSKDELISYIKELINKGNISRIKVKKDDEVIVDIPVNAGIATGLLSLAFPSILALGFITAVVTKVTIEITKTDGSIEVINKIIKNAVSEVKDKVNDLSKDVRERVDGFSNEIKGKSMDFSYMKDKVGNISHEIIDRVGDISNDIKEKLVTKKDVKNDQFTGDNNFTYTVKFDEDTSKDDK